MQAYNHRLKSFAQYQGVETELCAFLDCGGCGICRETDRGMREKMERLQSMQVEKIHIGICIGKRCAHLEDIFAMLDRYAIPYERGTH